MKVQRGSSAQGLSQRQHLGTHSRRAIARAADARMCEILETRLLLAYIDVEPYSPQVLTSTGQTLSAYSAPGTPMTVSWLLYSNVTGATLSPGSGTTSTYTGGSIPGFDFVQATSASLATTIPVSVSTTNQLTVTMTSLDRLWIDANKPGTGAKGAWLAYTVTNPSLGANDTVSEFTNLTLTFGGFDAASQKYNGTAYPTTAPLFRSPLDSLRTIPSLKDGQSMSFYFYVDYSHAIDQGVPATNDNTSAPKVTLNSSNPLTGFTANYALTVGAPQLPGTHSINFKGIVRTEQITTASAAGQTLANTLGPGAYVGQLMYEDVRYEYGNNQGVWFMPAAEAGFHDDVYRLVGIQVTGLYDNKNNPGGDFTDVRTGAYPQLSSLQNRLWFSYVGIGSSNNRVQVRYFWDVLKTGIAQNVTPWGGGQSGTQFKYQIADATLQTILPAATLGATIGMNVSLLVDADGSGMDNYTAGDTIKYTVTLTNTTSPAADIYTHQITDLLPSYVQIDNATYTGSGVTALNSAGVPATGATGTVNWYGYDLEVSPDTSYRIAAGGTLTLIYTAQLMAGIPAGTYTNSITAKLGSVTLGPATASFNVTGLADLGVSQTNGKTKVLPGDSNTYTITVSNAGPATITSLTLTDTIPAALLNPVWGTPSSGSYDSITGVWSGLTLASGQSVTITLSGTISPSATGSITNSVTLAAPAGVTDTDPANNSASDTDTFYVPPVANIDSRSNQPPGTVTLNVTANDTDADGDLVVDSVDLDPATPGRQTTLVVSGQGTWTVDALGNVTFTPQAGFTLDPTPISYTVSDAMGLVSNQISFTSDYAPVTANDYSYSNVLGSAVTVAVLANDATGDTPVPGTIDLDPSTPGQQLTKIVSGQGTWTANPATGEITFTPQSGFYYNPAPITYCVQDAQGNSASATVTVGYEHPFSLVLDDLGTPQIDVIVVDNMPAGALTAFGPSTIADASSVVGQINFSGAAGVFTSNRVTAQSAPIVGTATEPEIRISSVDRNLAPGSLVIWATDTCLTVPTVGIYQLNSPVGGVAAGTLSFREMADLNNNPFGQGPYTNLVTTQSPTYSAGAYSGSQTQTFMLSSLAPVSLTKRISMTHAQSSLQTGVTAGGVIRRAVPPAPPLKAAPSPGVFSNALLVSDNYVLISQILVGSKAVL